MTFSWFWGSHTHSKTRKGINFHELKQYFSYHPCTMHAHTHAHTHTRKALLKEKKKKKMSTAHLSVLHPSVGTILHKGAENTYQNDWMLQRYIYNNDAGTINL